MEKKILRGLLILPFIFGSPVLVGEYSPTGILLLKNLLDFANQHSIDQVTMWQELGALVLEDHKIDKGGTAIINPDVFVDIESKDNVIFVGGSKWIGSPLHTNEVVFINGDKIQHSMLGDDARNSIIVIFSPEEVRFIDLPRKMGGIYKRHTGQ